MTKPRHLDILEFWGKAQPIDPAQGPGWHPLVFHGLDVAAVGDALLMRHPGFRRALPHLLGLTREDTVRLIRFLLAVHDIGKFAKRFQAKVPDLYPACFGDSAASVAARYDHGAGGLRLFGAVPDLFSLPGETGPGVWWPLLSAVMGHHGTPPDTGNNDSQAAVRAEFGRSGIDAARSFVHRIRQLFTLPKELPRLERARVRRASYAVAGLAVLSDWIGSKQEWFPYQDPASGLEGYWSLASQRAADAIERAEVLPAGSRRSLDYGDLIGDGIVLRLSPMQQWARTVELPAGPALFMIEDETGSGKTEAALMLAHRLMAHGHADGLYIALPTMATANAMFDRLAASHLRLFTADSRPSIALAHGARDLHPGFRSVTLRAGREEAPYGGSKGRSEQSDTTASAACAAWIADDRRRAFLADVGAGTIDQALLSVLPSRHQSLRLLGLMRRVLILDEVHAYDPYVQREMERLLEFQASLGGSAILLSATLPLSIRQRLASAFSKGLGVSAEHADSVMGYPLATVCACGGTSSTTVPGQARRARTLPVRFLRSSEEALSEVVHAARADKAVLYIRNTVDDALVAHAALAARGLAPALFHARFALADRLNIETNVVARFGKRSDSAARSGQVLVATQVVEQSLDLDFDVLISDLAPIDLLIQRAGRLWRHDRPERTGRPELLVVAPEAAADTDEQWFARAFPRAKYVYRDHARLWLTVRALEDAGEIESPAGLRRLVESVYGHEADARLPKALQGYFFDAESRAGADRGIATANLLELNKGYVRDGGAWDADIRTPTRLNDDPQITLRLACIRDGRVEPYAAPDTGDELWRAWRLSEVSAPARRVAGEVVLPEHVDAVRQAKAAWTRYDGDKILVVLEETVAETTSLCGSAVAPGPGRGEVHLRYDRTRGLEVLADGADRRTVPDEPAG